MTDQGTDQWKGSKCSDKRLEVKLNALLGKYDILMDHPRDRSASIVALEVILNALIGKYDRLTD